jgi:transcriptional regulator with XRE-family HTH domain
MGRTSRPKPKFLVDKLSQIRRSLSLSQTEVLIKIGYSPDKKEFRRIISAYELGKREPMLLDLLNYSRIAGVSLEKIIDDELELYE